MQVAITTNKPVRVTYVVRTQRYYSFGDTGDWPLRTLKRIATNHTCNAQYLGLCLLVRLLAPAPRGLRGTCELELTLSCLWYTAGSLDTATAAPRAVGVADSDAIRVEVRNIERTMHVARAHAVDHWLTSCP